MVRKCQTDSCNRTLDAKAHSDVCVQCTNAQNSAIKRLRAENQQQTSRNRRNSRDRAISNSRDFFSISHVSPEDLSCPTSVSSPMINSSSTTTIMTTPTSNTTTSTASLTGSFPALAPRQTNMAALRQLQNSLDPSDPAQNLNKQILGLLVDIRDRQEGIEPVLATVKSDVENMKSRMNSIEAKVGDQNEPSIPLSLAIRGLPLPSSGSDDLALARRVIAAVSAPGVDPDRDVVKAVRRGAKENNLGTVLVEITSKEKKGNIMKSKRVLESSENETLRKIIIKNALSDEQMKNNRAMNELLKMIPGGSNHFIAGNGTVRPRNLQPPHRVSSMPRYPFPPPPSFPRPPPVPAQQQQQDVAPAQGLPDPVNLTEDAASPRPSGPPALVPVGPALDSAPPAAAAGRDVVRDQQEPPTTSAAGVAA